MTANEKIGEPAEGSCTDPQSPEEALDDSDIEAYQQLNQEMDEINSCLDALEQKNDSLHREIFKLLEESRKIRSELKEAGSSAEPSHPS